MKRFRYPVAFSMVVIGLTVLALGAYGRISTGLVARPEVLAAPRDTTPIFVPAQPGDRARYAAEDSAWRATHARPITLAELRARGDGTRSPRQALQDRVYAHSRRGEQGRAITELERWMRSNPADREALLWLARLLAKEGRTEEAVRRYREVIALEERRAR